METFELRHQLSVIPNDKKGLYWFCLRFPTAYRMGLRESNGKVYNLNHFIDKIIMFSKVINNIDVNTRIKFKRSIYLSTSFDMVFNTSDSKRVRMHLENVLGDKTLIELRNIIKLLSFSVEKLPPIYIGITDNQSFKQRFNQHFNGDTSLLPGMIKF